MLFILLNWILITYISFTIGYGVRRMFIEVPRRSEIAFTVIWGLCTISLVSTSLLFFVNAGVFLLMMLLVGAMVAHYVFRHEIGDQVKEFVHAVFEWRVIAFGAILLFCLLVLSSQPSKINDDGFYYTQTVMWFTQQGFVHGISNLLLPLGLASSWHVLQAVFSFDFIDGIRFNDLNGLMVFVFFIYYLEGGSTKNGNVLLNLLFAAMLIVSIPFLSACSPDLPVIVLTVIAFHLCVKGVDRVNLKDVFLFGAFAFSIKISSVAIVLLAVMMVFYAFRVRMFPGYGFSILLSLIVLSVIGKNVFQTGYPFFPFPWLGMNGLSWMTPEMLLQQYAVDIKAWGLLGVTFFRGGMEWNDPDLWETVKMLWQLEGFKGIINAFILVSFPLILLACFLDMYQRRKQGLSLLPYLFVHIAFILNFFIWLEFAPQYRFMLPVYVFYVPWILFSAQILLPEKLRLLWRLAPYASLAVVLILSLLPLSLNVSSTSTYIGKMDGLDADRLLRPHFSYAFDGVDTLTVNAQEYYHVRGNSYCWDSPLPCMSTGYHEFLKGFGYEVSAEGRAGKFRFELR